MGVINAAALVILGILVLRKLVLMERFFEVRVYLITTFLCGLLLFFVLYLIASDNHTCVPTPPGSKEFYCEEF